MASQVKDVLIIGFGAIGAMYSLIMTRGGQARVTVVARSNCDAVNAHGVHFKSGKYGEIKEWKPARVLPSVAQALDRPYSYVVVATKAIPELIRTPALLAPLLSPPYFDSHPQPVYVLMQNGLNVEAELYQTLKNLKGGEPKIISTVLWIGTAVVDNVNPTVVHNDFDRVLLGMYRQSTTITTNTPEEAALLADFNSIIAAGGSETTIVPEIQRVKFSKNLWNAAFGATAALSRVSLEAVFKEPPCPSAPQGSEYQTPSVVATSSLPSASPAMRTYTIPFIYDAFNEIYNLGTVLFPPSEAGPGLDPDVVLKTMEGSAVLYNTGTTHRASTLVDVENGRPTEVEVIVGELVRMGRQRGIAMPRIETLYALLLIVQEQLLRQYREKRAALL
ncbi:hypothetical protein AcW1_002534 [Taiwanofungus camphoratus]|nr:hypothetical protein AcV7_005409 [Antrodia cinnamomea]KAI0943357.1 hypothetical protein AcW1_002534 [Antrodia cinnamomea]